MKKQPKQERSKQIVDAVLTGATRILSQTPFKNVSTNKIAEIAGVSIGSLYDYFPNKKSIVSELIDRRVEDIVRQFKSILEKDSEKNLDEKAEEFVLFLRTDFIERKNFLREIFLLAPEQGRMELLYRSRAEVTVVLAEEILRRGIVTSAERARHKAFLLIQSVIGLVESYIIINPDYISEEEMVADVRRLIEFLLTE